MEIQGEIGAGKMRVKLAADSELAVMGVEGDVKTIWNPQNTDEVENARETFKSFRAKRYLAFRVTGDGSQGEQMNEFDPNASKMILVPPMAGG